MIPVLPDTAPFSPEQRAWLNGFFAGMLGMASTGDGAPAPAAAQEDDGELPWHDPVLELPQRLELSKGKPLRLKLMSAMGQLDCGQCGYLCKTYAQAIAEGAEKDVGKCVPGGKPTTKALKRLLEEEPAGTAASAHEAPTAVTPDFPPGPSRDRPARAKLIVSYPLSKGDRDTRAVSVATKDLGLDHEPGDSLGIWAGNDPQVVELILSILKTKGNKAVTLEGATWTAREALTSRVSLREPTAELFALMAEHAKLEFEAQRLALLAEDDERAASYGIRDVFDTLVKFRSARPPVGPFIQALSRMQPRLYSIASSAKRHPGEIHLTVGVVRYDEGGRGYLGLGSGYFAEHLSPGRPVPVFLQKSHGFRLPTNAATPIVMVGPGTGIAPFRAFLQEREAAGATGRNWLFFGAQHEATDFLYRDEMEAWRDKGLLTRLSTAFSRDQSQKIYVQHRMAEEAAELWKWLQDGAYFYVCGDAKHMAADVEHALMGVAMSQGGHDVAGAKAWLAGLSKEGRYLRDVY
jgi:sulfite reductase (NADPH) flavoprotein alpha-component